MSDSGLSVRQLLPARFERLGEVAKSRLQDDEGVRGAGLPGFVWGMIGDKAAGALDQVLNCDVFDVLAAAWQTARELHEFTDETKHPRGVAESVFLGKHDLTVTVYPVPEVRLGPTLHPRLKLTLELTAELQAATLTIENARIIAVEAGSGDVTAQLKYDTYELHKKLQSQKVNFTTPIRLPAPGLAIL